MSPREGSAQRAGLDRPNVPFELCVLLGCIHQRSADVCMRELPDCVRRGWTSSAGGHRKCLMLEPFTWDTEDRRVLEFYVDRSPLMRPSTASSSLHTPLFLSSPTSEPLRFRFATFFLCHGFFLSVSLKVPEVTTYDRLNGHLPLCPPPTSMRSRRCHLNFLRKIDSPYHSRPTVATRT